MSKTNKYKSECKCTCECIYKCICKSECKSDCKYNCKSLFKEKIISMEHKCHKYHKIIKYNGCNKFHKLEYCNKCNIYNNSEIKLFITIITLNSESLYPTLNIFGYGFLNAVYVNINNHILYNFIIVNDNEIIIHIPFFNEIELSVSISDNNYISDSVIYILGPSITAISPINTKKLPIITNINPSSGPMGPLINITIFGDNLSSITSLSCDNLMIANMFISIISPNIISFIMPLINLAKDIPIYVTNIVGNSNTVYYHGKAAPII